MMHPWNLMKHGSGGSLIAEHFPNMFVDLASSLFTTKTEKVTQQQGPINFSSHPVSNCHDLQLSSSLKILKTIRMGVFEPFYDHVQAQPGPNHKVLNS